MDHKAILTVRTPHGVTVTLFTNGHRVWNGSTIQPVPLDHFLDAVLSLEAWSVEGYRAAIEKVEKSDHVQPE